MYPDKFTQTVQASSQTIKQTDPFHSRSPQGLSGNQGIRYVPSEPPPQPIVRYSIFQVLWQRLRKNIEVYILLLLITSIFITMYVLIPTKITVYVEYPPFDQLDKKIELSGSILTVNQNLKDPRVHLFFSTNYPDNNNMRYIIRYNKKWECDGIQSYPETYIITEILDDSIQKICHEKFRDSDDGIIYEQYSWYVNGNRHLIVAPDNFISFDEIVTIKQTLQKKTVPVTCSKLHCMMSLFGLIKL